MSTEQNEFVMMPTALTAENGAKAALSGEYHVKHEVSNPDFCGCGRHDCEECDDEGGEPEFFTVAIPVDWTTIKQIYADAVAHFQKTRPNSASDVCWRSRVKEQPVAEPCMRRSLLLKQGSLICFADVLGNGEIRLQPGLEDWVRAGFRDGEKFEFWAWV